MNAKQVTLASSIVAVGAIARILLSTLAEESPTPVFGVLVKVGLTETLTITFGLAYGAAQGFLAGFLIIVVSDLFVAPGPWTPFIGGIIGILGLIAGILRKWLGEPTSIKLAVLAIPLTLLSEILQNAYVTIFYSMPFLAAMITGLPSLITALMNNVILLGALGPRLVRILQPKA
jgi:energy-coupling factor transport system substrate-specific component